MDPIEIFNVLNLKIACLFIASTVFLIAMFTEKGGITSKLATGFITSGVSAFASFMFLVIFGLGAQYLLTKERTTDKQYSPNYEHCELIYDETIENEDYQPISEARSEQEAIDSAIQQYKIESKNKQLNEKWDNCIIKEDSRIAALPGYDENDFTKKLVWIWN